MKKRILLLLIIIVTLSLFNNGITAAEGPKNYLKGKFYSSVKDHFLIATEKMKDDRFKKTFKDPHIYKNQIKVVCDRVKMSPIQHIVFTSSSSVYPKDSTIYSVSDNFEPPNLRAKVLLECEKTLNRLENISVGMLVTIQIKRLEKTMNGIITDIFDKEPFNSDGIEVEIDNSPVEVNIEFDEG